MAARVDARISATEVARGRFGLEALLRASSTLVLSSRTEDAMCDRLIGFDLSRGAVAWSVDVEETNNTRLRKAVDVVFPQGRNNWTSLGGDIFARLLGHRGSVRVDGFRVADGSLAWSVAVPKPKGIGIDDDDGWGFTAQLADLDACPLVVIAGDDAMTTRHDVGDDELEEIERNPMLRMVAVDALKGLMAHQVDSTDWTVQLAPVGGSTGWFAAGRDVKRFDVALGETRTVWSAPADVLAGLPHADGSATVAWLEAKVLCVARVTGDGVKTKAVHRYPGAKQVSSIFHCGDGCVGIYVTDSVAWYFTRDGVRVEPEVAVRRSFAGGPHFDAGLKKGAGLSIRDRATGKALAHFASRGWMDLEFDGAGRLAWGELTPTTTVIVTTDGQRAGVVTTGSYRVVGCWNEQVVMIAMPEYGKAGKGKATSVGLMAVEALPRIG